MTRTSLLSLIIACGFLGVSTAWSQVDEESADKARDKSGSKLATKARGDNAARKLEKSQEQLTFDSFSKAMQWELKSDQATTEKIKELIKEYRPKEDRNRTDDGNEEGNAADDPHRAIKDEALKAAADGDQKRFRELMDKIPGKMSATKGQHNELDPAMLYTIDSILKEPLRNDYWQILARFTNKDKVNPGGRYLDLLDDIDVTPEQGAKITRHYQTYLNELREAQKGDPEAMKEVRKTFQESLMAELNKEQRVQFQLALKTAERTPKKGGEAKARW